MKDDPNSLQNLHDLVAPAEISWWPLAPGWYGMATLLLVAAIWLCFRAWKQWRRNAYRRAAMKQLEQAADGTEVAEILRRTALAFASRDEIASKTGDDWADWLASVFPDPMPEEVRRSLGASLYQSQSDPTALASLREYAAQWIRHHSSQPTQTTLSTLTP
ncbi:MAG: DUF4381 domain-containing protein [Verrucomicrobiales bacterium]|jgi:ABC-type nickel/cobalt efflux system permease component RcnA|nr:DUF4381 domain-containing protein [Verrucomicrobiales bacterium]